MFKFKRRYLSILLNLLLIYPLVLAGAPSGSVLCVAGTEHIALEPAHRGSHSISLGLMFERETIASTFTQTTHKINNEWCTDIPLLTDISAQRRTFLANERTCKARMLVSSPMERAHHETLYNEIAPKILFFETSIDLSLRTTILLV